MAFYNSTKHLTPCSPSSFDPPEIAAKTSQRASFLANNTEKKAKLSAKFDVVFLVES
jgi:hypothetical protein